MFCYSTSGNSLNVCEAAKEAVEKKITVVGFIGDHDKTKLGPFGDAIFTSPSSETPIIQEFHTIAGHEICSIVENKIFLKMKIKAIFYDFDGVMTDNRALLSNLAKSMFL